jgi:putative photosynthetic complex assembly protein
MTESHARTAVPQFPLLAAMALVVLTIAGTAAVRWTGLSPSQAEDAPTVAERKLHFDDQADGSIAIRDARDGTLVDTVEPGTQGFVRGTLRGLARERKRQGLGPETPFELLGRADGRLTLVDPATGRRVDLESFGPTNAAAFAKLIDPPRGAAR